jgi:hypothetical protein
MTDITVEGTISKINPDRQEVFGWASITKMSGRDVVDLQGDYIETNELERAAYDYVLNSRVGGEMHQRVGKSAPKQIGTLIESMVITPEKVEKMGFPPDTPHGWWIGFKVNDDNVWKAVKDSKYTGFSIHGKGVRKQMAYEDIGKSDGTGMEDMRERLLEKAFTHASDEREFIKNMAGIADALNEREHPEAHYFGEVVKHLIGRHEQEDHDPTKKGGSRASHTRQGHNAGVKRGAKKGAMVGAGLGAAAGLLTRNPMVAASMAAGYGGMGAAFGYQSAGEGLFNTSSKLGGFGNAMYDPYGTINRRIRFGSSGNKDKRIKKSLTKKEFETLSNYLG